MHFNKLKWCFEIVFYHFTILGFKNAKIHIFGENSGFECIFFLIEEWVISNRLANLKKHLTSGFWPMKDFFMIFFNKSSFSTFSDISQNNQLQILIALYAFYFM